MTNLRKAAEMALEAGETTIRLLRAEAKYPALVAELDDVFDALRAALAKPDEVAAAVVAEREACAKACDSIARQPYNWASENADAYFHQAQGADRCAATIRARSKP